MALSVYPWLMYLGALPFIAMAGASFLGLEQLPLGLSASQGLTSYTLLIVAFMAGTLWSHGLSLGAAGAPHLLFSNLIALIAWFSFLLDGTRVFFLVCTIGFLSMLWLDYLFSKRGMLSFGYIKDRCYVTCLVVASLAVSMINGG